MDDKTTPKRKLKCGTTYSSMTIEDAERRLGFMLIELESQAIPVEKMLEEVKCIENAGVAILRTKERVYDRIRDHLIAEGYSSEADPHFKEANASDLVYVTIVPIIADISTDTRRTLKLYRERQLLSIDCVTSGCKEFVVVDKISLGDEKFVLVLEAKRSSLGQALKQCLLAMKDMSDSNGGGMVYGFTTTGNLWQMVAYDGRFFTLAEQFPSLFPTMGMGKERRMKDFSVLVDCMYTALCNGGIVA